jgi:hypothetical protein
VAIEAALDGGADPLFVELDPVDAALRKERGDRREPPHRLERVVRDQRDKDVQLELTANRADRDRGVAEMVSGATFAPFRCSSVQHELVPLDARNWIRWNDSTPV